MSALLETRALTAFYGDFQALYGIDFEIAAGEVVAIIGANGAGKSTFLGSLAGLVRAGGDGIVFDGGSIERLPAHVIARRGLALVPEGRRLFPSLDVEENLMIGADRGASGPWTLAAIYDLFPMLRERRKTPANALSGGQQQMVAIARALMSNPRLLLCDELSLGLAPAVVKDIYAILPRIRAAGAALVLVEQDIGQALAAADRVYCFQEGRVSLVGRADALTREDISRAYFGLH
jgi:branched-chain amino acid transport system ATP-binding protein